MMTIRTIAVRMVAMVGMAAVIPAGLCRGDWPMWRGDAGRTASSSNEIPGELHLQWTRSYPRLEPAWPDEGRLTFDHAYHPVAAGTSVFLASPRSDWVMSLNAATGAEKWRFYTDGPVRFAPCVWKDRLFVASDDGYLYCLAASDGRLLWKYAGAPDAGRLIIGNKRVISSWPARGGPVVLEGRVYFAAGIWPFMGVFVHAVDAATGARIWTNSGSGATWTGQPHSGAVSFGGPAPQGYLVAHRGSLLVPSSRAAPACFDLETGRLRYFHLAANKSRGGYAVAAFGGYFCNNGAIYELAGGKPKGNLPDFPVLSADGAYVGKAGYAVRELAAEPPPSAREKGKPERIETAELWSLSKLNAKRCWIRAGQSVVADDGKTLMVIGLPEGGKAPELLWKTELDGAVASVMASGGWLLAVTDAGSLHCFGAGKVEPTIHPAVVASPPAGGAGSWGERARRVVTRSLPIGGYVVAMGAEAGEAALALCAAGGEGLHAVALVGADSQVERARQALDGAGFYGPRASVLPADRPGLRLPPYMAAAIVVTDSAGLDGEKGSEQIRSVFHALRPYGGTAFFPPGLYDRLAGAVADPALAGARVEQAVGFALLVRAGPLPGAGSWTHQYANPGNTAASRDSRVKAPLGLLWYGGSSNVRTLPRHGHGPAPQVAGGRILIEGPDNLRAMDAYTGRELWDVELPGLGQYYNSTRHQPGANALGSNHVLLEDAVYVVHKGKGLRLDPDTGKVVREFILPPMGEGGGASGWGYIAASGRVLLAGSSPQTFEDGVVDFGPDELKKRDAAEVIKWLGTLKEVALPERDEDDDDPEYAAAALNAALGLKDLPSRLPRKPQENAEGMLAARLGEYVRARPELSPYDVELRRLNRSLLNAVNERIPKSQGGAKFSGRPGSPGSHSLISSGYLVAFDRHSGAVLWTVKARQGFRHNAIAAGNGKVFCLDRFPDYVLGARRANLPASSAERLLALDIEKGSVLWSSEKDIFGTWLGYSDEDDILLQAARPSGDHLPERGERMAVYRGADGRVLWARNLAYSGPPLLIGKEIITQPPGGCAISLLTGEPVMHPDPLTGVATPWKWGRLKGCNTAVGSTHLLTFRSGAAGYVDLCQRDGTGNLGGFKSGCTSNMIIGDGLLCVPDYTRTCTCSYPIQTSLALLHDEDAETWTWNSHKWTGAPVQRMGVNFGAPGDRRALDGTLWVEWPGEGSPSPRVPVSTQPKTPATFRMHATGISGPGHRWVAASGLRGVTALSVDLGKGPERLYTVRLVFAEPDETVKPGGRVFGVSLQGKRVLETLDVVKEAGAPRRVLAWEFKGISVGQSLKVELIPVGPGQDAILCGIEAIREP